MPDYPDHPVVSPNTPPKPVVHDGRTAPHCMVRFECPKCGLSVVEDAYRGPITCEVKSSDPKQAHGATFMKPLFLQLEG